MKLKLFFSLIGLSFCLTIGADEFNENSYAKSNILATAKPSSFSNFNKPKAKDLSTPEPTLTAPQKSLETTLFAQFLYWKFSHDIKYGFSGIGRSNQNPFGFTGVFNVETPGRSFYPSPSWHPGCKVGIKFNMGEDNLYDILFSYSWIGYTLKNHFGDPGNPPSYKVSNFMNEANQGYVWIHHASIREKVTLNWFNLEAGYTFKNTNFSFRPFLGIHGFYDRNRLKVIYEFDQLNPSAPPRPEHVLHYSTSNTGGFGPMFGAEGFFNCSKNFGFFARGSTALLWGWQDVDCTNTNTEEFPPGTLTVLHVVKGKDKPHQNGHKYDFLIGPRCDFWFKNESSHLYALAALEVVLITGAEVIYFNADNEMLTDNTLARGFTFEVGYQF